MIKDILDSVKGGKRYDSIGFLEDCRNGGSIIAEIAESARDNGQVT